MVCKAKTEEKAPKVISLIPPRRTYLAPTKLVLKALPLMGAIISITKTQQFLPDEKKFEDAFLDPTKNFVTTRTRFAAYE